MCISTARHDRNGPATACGTVCETSPTKPITHCCTKKASPTVTQQPASPARSLEIDVEKAAFREHVVLKVSGMDCIGCTKKLKSVLEQFPAIYNVKVTFVSGSATFDLDNTRAKLQELLPEIEKKTGYKCSPITSAYQHLDVLASPGSLDHISAIEGVTSVEHIKSNKHRITYNPQVVGARNAVPSDARLAPPELDDGAVEQRVRLQKLAWSTGLAAAFTIPIAVLNWSNNPVPETTRAIVSLVLATAVQAIAIPEFYIGAFRSLIYSRVVEMDMLVVISITAAYGYSVCAFGVTEAGIRLEQGAFFETSTMLVALVLLGRLLAAIARTRAVSAVSVNSLQAVTTLLVHPDGRTVDIDSRLLHFGDTIRIRPEARIVTDGKVVWGNSAVDESTITGENDPVAKEKGSAVVAGTINGPGPLEVQVSRLVGANSITDIAGLVQNAIGAKIRVQDLADKVSSWFVPIVVIIAIAVFAIWLGVAIEIRDEDAGGSIGTAITYTIAVLAVSCPCALGLAVPMVLVIAGGVAARAGVVIKSADALERGYKITDVVFDKTGTLTNGDMHVENLEVFNKPSFTEAQALSLLYALARDNQHPVSISVHEHLKAKGVEPIDGVKDIRVIPGKGIEAEWNGLAVKVGNSFWLGAELNPQISYNLNNGMTVLGMMVDEQLVTIAVLKSTLRDEALKVVSGLQTRGIVCHIVSGDNDGAVKAVAVSLDINPSNVASRHAPGEKQRYVEALQSQGRKVLFCGDGTNDAVAIAQANVGVQMGRASDVSSAVADIVLLGGLDGVPTLLDISKQAFARIRFNFVWSAVYNVFAILLAAGAFVKVRIPPAYAGIGEIVSVGPVILAAATLAIRRRRT